MAQNIGRWKRSKIDCLCQQRTHAYGESDLGISEAERDEKNTLSTIVDWWGTLWLLSLRSHQAILDWTRIPWSGSTSRGNQTHSGGIATVTLDRVFLAWMERLDRWIITGG
jgi:hypothetical protein